MAEAWIKLALTVLARTPIKSVSAEFDSSRVYIAQSQFLDWETQMDAPRGRVRMGGPDRYRTSVSKVWS